MTHGDQIQPQAEREGPSPPFAYDRQANVWCREGCAAKQVDSVQYYRQKPIGNYIVAFYAPEANIVIEVDDSQHLESEQAALDY